jgi:hypothetical protein
VTKPGQEERLRILRTSWSKDEGRKKIGRGGSAPSKNLLSNNCTSQVRGVYSPWPIVEHTYTAELDMSETLFNTVA